MTQERCGWVTDDPLYIRYHDEEWGVPVHDDATLFEFLILEGAQAGLSWITVLRKRESYRKAFAGFDPKKIAKFDDAKVEALMKNEGIIRNRLKIESTILNAKAYLALRESGITLDKFLWSFVNYEPIRLPRKTLKDIPASTAESKAMSKALLAKGFKFVGPTICYAFMQACGLVQDHTENCFRATPKGGRRSSKRTARL